MITKDLQYRKFCAYGFLKNLRFYDPFIILFFRSAGLTFLEIGTLYSIREISQNLLEIPAGVLADSTGRKKAMMLCFGFYIVSFIVFYFSYTYWFFVIAMILYSFGDAFRTGTHKAMIFDYLRKQGKEDTKIHYYGYTRSWSQIGSAVSSLGAAVIVIITKDYRSVFLFSVIPFLLDLINISTYPSWLDGTHKEFDLKSIIGRFRDTLKDLVASFKQSIIFKVVGNTSLHSGYYKTLKDFIQPIIKQLAIGLPVLGYLETEQKSAILAGIIYFVIYVLTSVSTRYSGKFSDMFENKSFPINITLYFGLIAGVLSGIFNWQGMEVFSIVFFIVIYLIENLRKPMGIALVSDYFNDDIQATALSAETQMQTIITALLAPTLGFLADSFGLGIGMAVLSVTLIGAGFFVRLKPEVAK